MKRDFNSIIHNLEGKPYEVEPGKPLTLQRVALDALGANMDSDRGMSGDEKFKLYALASRIVDTGRDGRPVELEAAEITTLKTRIGNFWSAFIMGPAYRILDADYSETE